MTIENRLIDVTRELILEIGSRDMVSADKVLDFTHVLFLFGKKWNTSPDITLSCDDIKLIRQGFIIPFRNSGIGVNYSSLLKSGEMLIDRIGKRRLEWEINDARRYAPRGV